MYKRIYVHHSDRMTLIITLASHDAAIQNVVLNVVKELKNSFYSLSFLKRLVIWLEVHWTLLSRVQLTISEHWFR